MNATQTCSHCGLDRNDPAHDSRCWPVAHAYAVVLEHARPGHVNDAPECDMHIVELARWLSDHPLNKYNGQQRADRERELDRWVAKAQLIASQGGAR